MSTPLQIVKEYVYRCISTLNNRMKIAERWNSTRPLTSRDNRAVTVFWPRALILLLIALGLHWLDSSQRILHKIYCCIQPVVTLITLWYVLLCYPLIDWVANKQLLKLCRGITRLNSTLFPFGVDILFSHINGFLYSYTLFSTLQSRIRKGNLNETFCYSYIYHDMTSLPLSG